MKWLARILDKSTNLSDYIGDARRWSSCAVGEVNEAMPKVVVYVPSPAFQAGSPVDRRLKKLGTDFIGAVRKNDRRAALVIYRAIETRVARLAGVRP